MSRPQAVKTIAPDRCGGCGTGIMVGTLAYWDGLVRVHARPACWKNWRTKKRGL